MVPPDVLHVAAIDGASTDDGTHDDTDANDDEGDALGLFLSLFLSGLSWRERNRVSLLRAPFERHVLPTSRIFSVLFLEPISNRTNKQTTLKSCPREEVAATRLLITRFPLLAKLRLQ